MKDLESALIAAWCFNLIVLLVVALLLSGCAPIRAETAPVIIETPSPVPSLAPLSSISVSVALASSSAAKLVEPEYIPIGTYWCTGYDPYCTHCCGKCDGITASGTQAEAGRTIAMWGYDFGTEIYIDGLGTFIVEDRCGDKSLIDVACVSHEACYEITGQYPVYVVERGAK